MFDTMFFDYFFFFLYDEKRSELILMVQKSVDATTLLIRGILLIGLGICLFFVNQFTLRFLLFLLGILTVLSACYSLFCCLFQKKRVLFVDGIGDLLIGSFILCFTDFILHSFAICFGFYLLLHIVISCIEYFLYRRNYYKGRLRIIVHILFQLFFLIPLLFNLEQNIPVISMILGIYLIVLGITRLTDFLTVLIPKRTTDKIKQQIQIPLPVFLNAFIPKKLVTLVNEMLEVEQDTKHFDEKSLSFVPDLFVLIHLADHGSAKMGHMEIAFEGQVYSYGNYDMHSRSFFDMIGDGVVLVANQEDYIRYVVTKKDRYVIEFGLCLTSKERLVIKKQLECLIHTDTEPYYPDLQLSELGLLPKDEYHDMSSEIYAFASGRFYKILKGKYKKFFVLKTNCAMVAQFVLSSIGKQILVVNGIITPGAYYDYLNDRFKLKNTNVVSRKVYTKDDF